MLVMRNLNLNSVQSWTYLNFLELTLASEDLSAPSSIVLASSCLRTIPYIAAVTRELTDCIVIILCGTPRASKPYSIQRYRKRWTSGLNASIV